MSVEMADRLRLDPAPGLAQLLPVVDLGDRSGTLVADRVGGVAEVVAKLRVAQFVAGSLRETLHRWLSV